MTPQRPSAPGAGWPARLALAPGDAIPAGATERLVPDGGRLAAAARRLRTHPRAMPYQRLIALVVLVNAGLAWHHVRAADWAVDDGSALSGLAALLLVNLTAAVVIRQQTVLNGLFGLAGRGSRTWPLWLRWSISKVHHVAESTPAQRSPARRGCARSPPWRTSPTSTGPRPRA